MDFDDLIRPVISMENCLASRSCSSSGDIGGN